MGEEFENEFRKMCWDYHIDDSSTLDSGVYREFTEEFYKLGLRYGKS